MFIFHTGYLAWSSSWSQFNFVLVLSRNNGNTIIVRGRLHLGLLGFGFCEVRKWLGGIDLKLLEKKGWEVLAPETGGLGIGTDDRENRKVDIIKVTREWCLIAGRGEEQKGGRKTEGKMENVEQMESDRKYRYMGKKLE